MSATAGSPSLYDHSCREPVILGLLSPFGEVAAKLGLVLEDTYRVVEVRLQSVRDHQAGFSPLSFCPALSSIFSNAMRGTSKRLPIFTAGSSPA